MAKRRAKKGKTQKKTRRPSGTPKKLWSYAEPWGKRPQDKGGAVAMAFGAKTGADRVRSMAVGWRPPKSEKYKELERKATILGGIQALQAGGISPWTEVDLAALPTLKTVNDKTYQPLMKVVRQAARPKKIRNLRAASEHMRKEVTKHGLGGPAWSARGLHLAIAAMNAQAKRGAVEGAVSSTLSLASTATASTGIGIPVAAVLTGLNLGAAAMANRTKVEKARSEGLVAELTAEFQQEMEKVGIKQEIQAAREQTQLVMAKAAEQQRVMELEAREEAERRATMLKFAAWGTAIGGTGLLIYAIARRRRAP